VHTIDTGIGCVVVPLTVVVAKIVVVAAGVGAVGGPTVGAVNVPSHDTIPPVVPQTCCPATHVNFTAPVAQIFEGSNKFHSTNLVQKVFLSFLLTTTCVFSTLQSSVKVGLAHTAPSQGLRIPNRDNVTKIKI
jgi:hypothetical protein